MLLELQHACVVRCFAMEEDAEFVYLALERCKHSLADVLAVDPPSEHLFVDSQGYPTPLCLQVLPLPVCLSVCLPACLSACLSICLSICLSMMCLSVCLSVCLFGCLIVLVCLFA